MNLHSVWKDPKTGKKKKKSVHKPKIRWQLLGLTDPGSVDTTPSIEAIRQEVSSLARHSVGSNTRSRSTAQESRSLGRNHKSGAIRSRRRGATEQTQDGA
jgi:hypothetical protein